MPSSRTAVDIDRQVQKVLRGLGRPEPPLDLAQVRELLDLDKAYYSSSDDGILRETLSKLRIAGRQIAANPMMLLDAVRKFDLKALYVPERKKILLDQDVPKLKHRWNEAHEIAHDIIPWHGESMLGDTIQTLTPTCHDHMESEANYGAGRLIFLDDLFVEESNEMPPKLDSIKQLSKRYGNTITSTLWRYVESARDDKAYFAMISDHPRYPGEDFDPLNPCKYFVKSKRFSKEFGGTGEGILFRDIQAGCNTVRRGPLGQGVLSLANDTGELYDFIWEAFYNTHNALILGWCVRKTRVYSAFRRSRV